jgi:hypothetical protein
MYTNKHDPSQPLPNALEERIWNFVREQISHYEERVGAKVAEFEIHLTDSGQIEVDVLATESANDAAIDEGLEDAGSKADVNRLKERDRLSEDIEKNT